jgi:hypothetical protein
MTTALQQAPSAVDPHEWSFARHETFHVRDGWLYKAMRAIASNPLALYAEDAHHTLGVGKNMLRAVLYWARVTGLVQSVEGAGKIQPPLELSSVGHLIYRHDPFFEDTATWWMAHIGLASNAALGSFWYWAFNHLAISEFAASELEELVSRFLRDHGAAGVMPSSLNKDAKCFLRSYVPNHATSRRVPFEDALDCPFAYLELLQPSLQPRRYRFIAGDRPSLPDEIVAYVLHRYRNSSSSGQLIFSLDELRWKPLSPGRLLGLSTEGLATKLRQLSQSGHIRMVTSTGLNTVSVDPDADALDFLRDYYGAGPVHG